MSDAPIVNTHELSKMVEIIAKALVDLPLEVSVAEVIGENTTVIELRVAKTDIGKIIGYWKDPDDKDKKTHEFLL